MRYKNKILFIGHLFHKRTKSSDFFINFLRHFSSVTTRFDDSYEIQPKSKADISDYNRFDKIVVWQVFQPAMELARICPEKLIYVPMADGMWTDGDIDVECLKNVRVLCFSSKQYYDLQQQGFKRLLYVRYAPATRWDIFKVVQNNYNKLRPFFWQRRRDPSWQQVVNMLSGVQYDSLTLEWKSDGDILSLPNSLDRQEHKIKLVEWKESRKEADKILSGCNLYFAPRFEEGIGMSFLDAMAMGIPVVALDNFTMNEYITDGYDGILYQRHELGKPNARMKLLPASLAFLGSNAIHKIDVINRHWEGIEKERIKEWMLK